MNNELVNKGWSQMEALLDERMPVQRKRRVAGYYWIAGAILVGLLSYLLYTSINSNTSVAEDQAKVISQASPTELNTPTINAVEANNLAGSDLKENKVTNKEQPSPKSNSDQNISTAPSSIDKSNQNPSISNKTAHNSVKPKRKKGDFTSSNKSNKENTKPINLVNASVNLDHAATETENINSSSASSPEDQSGFNNTLSTRNSKTPSTSKLHLIHLKSLDYPAKLNLPTNTSIQIEPRLCGFYGREIFAQGHLGSNSFGGSLGFSLLKRISNNFIFSYGVEVDHTILDKYEHQENAMLPTSAIFSNAGSYSGYLADNVIESTSFISNMTTVYLPLDLRYGILEKVEVSVGIRPGIQINQSLNYAPIISPDENYERSPQIDNGNLSADDFFNQKSVAVVQTSFGIRYNLKHHVTLGAYYHHGLSDYGRGVQYADIQQLERLGADETDRRFYSIPQSKLKSNVVGLRLNYRF